MSYPSKTRSLIVISFTACLCLMLAGDASAALRRLSRLEVISYRTWVKNLQPDETDDEQVISYYPGFEKVQPEWAKKPQGRMQAAVRSVVAIEDVLIREWEKSKNITSEQALGVARSYRLASEYDTAMNWFDRAMNDGDMDYPPAPGLAEEIFATAILSGDSLIVTRQLLNTIGYSDLTGYDNTLILAFRHLLAQSDSLNLRLLQDKVDGQQRKLQPEALYWFAFTLSFNNRYQECLGVLRALVTSGDHSRALTLEQKQWVLRSIPDLFYVLGYADQAQPLYQALATGQAEQAGDAGDWARYQTANLLYIDGDYEGAWIYYQAFLAMEPNRPWQRRAKEMANIFVELKELRKEGVPYGIDDVHLR